MGKVQKKFIDLYNERKNLPTPGQLFVREVALLTDRSEHTVRMWLSGNQTPDPNVARTIGNHFGVDAETLFTEN